VLVLLSILANTVGPVIELMHMGGSSLGQTNEKRQTAYRELFRNELKPGVIDEIRQATNGNFTLGSARFKKEMAKALGRRVTPGKSGRSPKNLKSLRINYSSIKSSLSMKDLKTF